MVIQTRLFIYQSKTYCYDFNINFDLLLIACCFFFSIEGEYVPLPGDQVHYRLCPIPPKLEKFQAVHVEIVNLTPQVHLKWDSPENN